MSSPTRACAFGPWTMSADGVNELPADLAELPGGRFMELELFLVSTDHMRDSDPARRRRALPVPDRGVEPWRWVMSVNRLTRRQLLQTTDTVYAAVSSVENTTCLDGG